VLTAPRLLEPLSLSSAAAAAGAFTDARVRDAGALGASASAASAVSESAAAPVSAPADDTLEDSLADFAGPRRDRVADDDVDAPSDADASVDEPADPVESAKATGRADRPDPTPRATANAPTRPTYRAKLGLTESDADEDRRAYSIERIKLFDDRLWSPAGTDEVGADIIAPSKAKYARSPTLRVVHVTPFGNRAVKSMHGRKPFVTAVLMFFLERPAHPP